MNVEFRTTNVRQWFRNSNDAFFSRQENDTNIQQYKIEDQTEKKRLLSHA